jgi:hypothetical protein
MKKIIICLLISTNLFAFYKCYDFPINDKLVVRNIKITEQSQSKTYLNCSDSLLIKDRFIAPLSQVYESKFGVGCVYTYQKHPMFCR